MRELEKHGVAMVVKKMSDTRGLLLYRRPRIAGGEAIRGRAKEELLSIVRTATRHGLCSKLAVYRISVFLDIHGEMAERSKAPD